MVGRDRFSQLLPLQLPETISPSCPPSLPNTPDARKRAKTKIIIHKYHGGTRKRYWKAETLALPCAQIYFRLDVLIFICFLLFSAALCFSQGGEGRQKPVSEVTSIQSSGGGFWSKINIVLSQGYHDTPSSYQMDHRHGAPLFYALVHVGMEEFVFATPGRKVPKPQDPNSINKFLTKTPLGPKL